MTGPRESAPAALMVDWADVMASQLIDTTRSEKQMAIILRVAERRGRESAEAELNAGREWMRSAWYELNAIRARDGSAPGVSEEWWSRLTDSLADMLKDDTVPWMLGAAKLLVRPYEARAESAEKHVAELETALREYGDHKFECICFGGVSDEQDDCSCGYNAALSASEAKP